MTKHFTKFDFKLMDKFEKIITEEGGATSFIEEELRQLLSVGNVTFVLSNINRLQSTILCELGFSYVQQSQRYVPISMDFISELTNNITEDALSEGRKLVEKSINLYKLMTTLKDNVKTGRPKRDDFKYGINYEEARCILPLCISTNIVTSMSADKLIDLFKIFKKYYAIFYNLSAELKNILPLNLYLLLDNIGTKYMNDNEMYMIAIDDYIKDLSVRNNVIPIDLNDTIENITIGTLASQNLNDPYEVYKEINDKKECHDIVSRVLGYGHTGILEQGRYTFAMQCSLSTYHQVIRHRLHTLARQDFKDIIFNDVEDFVIPDSIQNNEIFYEKIMDLILEYKEFYSEHFTKYDKYNNVIQYLLNGSVVKFTVSSNIRHDNWIFRERLCFTAQTEIRELFSKKFDFLYKVNPELVREGLPPCLFTGKCKEGKLNCGRLEEVKEAYSKYLPN